MPGYRARPPPAGVQAAGDPASNAECPGVHRRPPRWRWSLGEKGRAQHGGVRAAAATVDPMAAGCSRHTASGLSPPRAAQWGRGAGGRASQSPGVVWCVPGGDACIYASSRPGGIGDGQTAQPLQAGARSGGPQRRAGDPWGARRRRHRHPPSSGRRVLSGAGRGCWAQGGRLGGSAAGAAALWGGPFGGLCGDTEGLEHRPLPHRCYRDRGQPHCPAPHCPTGPPVLPQPRWLPRTPDPPHLGVPWPGSPRPR